MVEWYEGRMRLRDRRRRRTKEKQRAASKAFRAMRRAMGDRLPHRERWRAREDCIDRTPITFHVDGYYWFQFCEPHHIGSFTIAP